MRRTIAAVMIAAHFALGTVQAQEQADFNIPELTGTWTTNPAFADLYAGDQALGAVHAQEQADFNIPELTGTWTTNPAFADEYQDDRRAIEASARIASDWDRLSLHRSLAISPRRCKRTRALRR